MINPISPSFTGFDNVTAGKLESPQAQCYVISARLNNEGVNDLDRFSKILSNTNDNDILTVHYEKVDKDVNMYYPNGVSMMDINGFPLILDTVELSGADDETVKLIENTTLPLATHVCDLLKRIISNPINKNTDLIDESFDSTADSMCGMYKEVPGVYEQVQSLIRCDAEDYGEEVQRISAKNILDGITAKMAKYFE